MTQPLVSRPPYGEGKAAVGYVYLITNTVNGKQYVGQTTLPISRRWVQHRSSAKKGSGFALHAAIRKYGEAAFTLEVLEVLHTSEDLRASERRHIVDRESTSPKGYNLTLGGEGVDYAVPGVREKHKAAMRALPRSYAWREALKQGIQKRQADPEYRERQVEGCRTSGLQRRSPNCTLCGVPLTEANISRRSWCKTCLKSYMRDYKRKHRQKLAARAV